MLASAATRRLRPAQGRCGLRPRDGETTREERISNRKWHARRKIKVLLRGEGTDPFMAESLRVLAAKDVAHIEAGLRARYDRLSDEQKKRLRRSGDLVLAWLSDPQFEALADYQRPEA